MRPSYSETSALLYSVPLIAWDTPEAMRTHPEPSVCIKSQMAGQGEYE